MHDKLMATMLQIAHHAGPHVAQAYEADLQHPTSCKQLYSGCEEDDLTSSDQWSVTTDKGQRQIQ